MLQSNNEKDHLILGHLETHRGREKAIPAKELSSMVQMSTRDLRRRIKYLIEQDGILIGSAHEYPAGYWLIVDADEMDEAVGPMINHAVSMLKRVARIKKISYDELYGQVRLV